MTINQTKTWTVTVSDKEPATMRELLDHCCALVAVSEAKSAIGDRDAQYKDDAGFDRNTLFDATSKLEELAPQIPIENLDDAVAALDFLKRIVDWNYEDKRDQRLFNHIRQSLAEMEPARNGGRT
ncbi:hypothetical protein [Hyphococcus sp.]|uniref:hypothetical protein n=1 Tax=Hyphococcus sp. TaxID=2038636 RepID=UPI00207F9F0B|nr:MAG: hypothetical protein DHS20C04_30490 [Marinicaulis sp.]